MRPAWAVALLLLTSPPAAAQAPATTLAPDTEARWVPFDLTPGNQVRFRMAVNGRLAVAVLDTGVSYTVASAAFANRIGLHPAAAGHADAIGGSVPLGWAAVESLALGGLTRSGGRVAIANLTAIVTGGSEPVDMLIGADLLGEHGLEIDYDARRFRLLRSGRMPFRGTSVPLALASRSGIFISELTVGGRRLRPVIVDTGDGSAITLSHEAWAAARLPTSGLTTAYSYGLGGGIETDLAVLPALRVGPLEARNVEIRIERGEGFSKLTGTAGRIGSSFLQRYRVLFDPRAGRMILTPGATADRPPIRSTSGLLVALEGRSLRVVHVMRGSPAAKAGWRADERICRIDGVEVPQDYSNAPIAIWPADAPGRTVRLGLCNGPERALTLSRFY